jgi:hypothetical protein
MTQAENEKKPKYPPMMFNEYALTSIEGSPLTQKEDGAALYRRQVGEGYQYAYFIEHRPNLFGCITPWQLWEAWFPNGAPVQSTVDNDPTASE